jgi:P27 family predicted phage terminase small subunit
MGTRGPAPTPTPILAIRGSWRAKTRLGEPKPPRGKPTCPKSFTAEQRKVWKKLCAVLDAMNVLTHADGHQLERYCTYLVRWRDCEAFLARHGISYPIKSDDPTYYVARVPNTKTAVVGFAEHPQLRESHRLDAALKQIEAQFGLTPAARSRLHADQPQPVSSLSEFARKRYFGDNA